eukprot:6055308-Alexandrium_andersonii.AAC.1
MGAWRKKDSLRDRLPTDIAKTIGPAPLNDQCCASSATCDGHVRRLMLGSHPPCQHDQQLGR